MSRCTCTWLAIALAASCAREGAADQVPPAKPPAPAKDASMSDQPIHVPPPPPSQLPAEDTARYVAWMGKRGKPVGPAPDKAREEVLMRLGDWGFFEHGPQIGAALDRAAL